MMKLVTLAFFLNGKKDCHTSLSSDNYNGIFICDGGMKYFSPKNHLGEKIFFVGDLDSSSCFSKKKKELQKRDDFQAVLLDSNKDVSDFGCALDLAKKEFDNHDIEIHIFGGLGGRRDHEWLNVLETVAWMSQQSAAVTCFFGNDLCLFNHKISLQKERGSVFSVWGFEQDIPVKIQGACYSGEFILKRPSHGLSNKKVGEDSLLQLESPAGKVLCLSFVQ